MRQLLILLAVLGLGPVAVSSLARADDLVLGSSMPQNPGYELRSKAFERGSRLYFDKINAKGGISGRKVRFVVLDDRNDGKKVIENATSLLTKEKANLLFEFYGSLATKVIVPFLDKSEILFLAPITGQSYQKQVHKSIFAVRGGFELEAETLIDFLIAQKQIRKIGIFTVQVGPSEPGSIGRAAAYAALRARGLEFAAAENRPESETDMSAVVNSLAKSGARAVFVWGRSAKALDLIRASHAKGYKPIFVVPTGVGSPDFLEGLMQIDGGSAEAYIAQPVPSFESKDSALVAHFKVDAAQAGLGPEFQTSAELEGYLNAAFVTELLQRAHGNYSTAKLRELLESMKNVEIEGVPISFSPENHTGVHHTFLGQIKGGNIIPL